MSDTWNSGPKFTIGDRLHFLGRLWVVGPGRNLIPLPKPKDGGK